MFHAAVAYLYPKIVLLLERSLTQFNLTSFYFA